MHIYTYINIHAYIIYIVGTIKRIHEFIEWREKRVFFVCFFTWVQFEYLVEWCGEGMCADEMYRRVYLQVGEEKQRQAGV